MTGAFKDNRGRFGPGEIVVSGPEVTHKSYRRQGRCLLCPGGDRRQTVLHGRLRLDPALLAAITAAQGGNCGPLRSVSGSWSNPFYSALIAALIATVGLTAGALAMAVC
jgi:hypothetical protein